MKNKNVIRERRFCETKLEVRQVEGVKVIEGHAAVFNTLSLPMFGFVESIRPGAFTDTISEDDVRALFNHDINIVLGRNMAKTLELSEDDKGLRYVITPPDTSAARDLVKSLERGDVSQSSFSFGTLDDKWTTVDGQEQREIIKAKLFDVGPVTFPQYPQADSGVASRGHDSARCVGISYRLRMGMEVEKEDLEFIKSSETNLRGCVACGSNAAGANPDSRSNPDNQQTPPEQPPEGEATPEAIQKGISERRNKLRRMNLD